MELTGFTEKDLENLMTQVHVEPEVEQDEVPEPPEEPVTKPGDLWILGRHRVLCGDCRVADDVAKLLGNAQVDSLVTDPPYGVDYGAKNDFLNRFDKGNRIQVPISNDAITDYRQFFAEFLSLVPFADHNTVYVFMSGKELHSLRLAAEDCKITWGDYLVWVKNVHVLGRKDYNARHEFVFYGWKGRHRFYGDFSTTVLEFDKPAKNELHPTQKPVPLVAKLISDGTPQTGVVYDPFAGSGTTLIAAEQLGRTCYAMEIEPRYCDVIIERWQNLTGQKAVREDGTPYN
jgi:site-specific DNA-methyltransferase (adenine-specific)